MSSEPYKVDHGSAVLKQIQAIRQYAIHVGKYEPFVEIMESALQRLQRDPENWGEPEYRSKHVGATVCHALIRPLVFRFVIFEQVQTVVLLSVRLYADFD